ncbi:putative golgin subfamily A member 2 [Apostichopus japonicus]|uniref:Putative golgin subfamily A member 2 n=1 Tax=Stichopus japonicus TaxID=307972 RepID=A0A2G8LL01_STIJA|nr:putative golgin subfamily A member 2 [Apostichopus japonicus]
MHHVQVFHGGLRENECCRNFNRRKTPSSAPAAVKAGKNAKGNKSVNPSKVSVNGRPNGPNSENPPQKITDTPKGPNEKSHNSGSRPLSSTESLRQLSRQLNGLMNETPLVNGTDGIDYGGSNVKELEVRNQELAAEVDQHAQSNRDLLIQIKELERQEFDKRTFKEQSALKEQLQVHIQTIGILVSEKSELQSLASQARGHLKQKAVTEGTKTRTEYRQDNEHGEHKDIDVRGLVDKGWREEKKETNRGRGESREDIDKERESLQQEVRKLRKSSEELKQQNSELTSQITTKTSENRQLINSVKELEERLSMSDLRVQQLAALSNHDTEGALQRMHEEKVEVENKLAQYAQAVQQLTAEREYLSRQYQTNTAQLQTHCQQLVEQVQLLSSQNNELASRQKELTDQIEVLKQPKADVEPTEAAEETGGKMSQQLLEELEKSNTEINRLHVLSSEQVAFKEDATDRKALLESIQNDKATISRAVAQNKDLKSQLEELQDAFVKMSENNMTLTTSLQSEQLKQMSFKQQLEDRGAELENSQKELDSRTEVINEKDIELESLKKELLQHAQMADRAHHYAAHQPLVESLQKELGDAQGTRRREQQPKSSRLISGDVEGSSLNQSNGGEPNDIVAELSAIIRQLEADRDQLRTSFIEEEAQRRALQVQLNQSLEVQGDDFQKSVTQEAFETLQLAMEQLQARFTQVMREKVDLIERYQELEHVNMQLTGETETIGEYITLYHNQRSVLKRRQEERERFVTMLAREKESMQEKLNQLQNLVMQLLQEKKELHPYQFSQGSPELPASFQDHHTLSRSTARRRQTGWTDQIARTMKTSERTGRRLPRTVKGTQRTELLQTSITLPTASMCLQITFQKQSILSIKSFNSSNRWAAPITSIEGPYSIETSCHANVVLEP